MQDLTPQAQQADLPQIITPEMAEAGALELLAFDWMECDPREAARRVFLAMRQAAR